MLACGESTQRIQLSAFQESTTQAATPHHRDPQRPRLYYGWVIVGIMAVVALGSTVQINPTLGVFVKPLSDDFGWSRTTLAGAVGVGTMLGGLSAPLIGAIIDRFGARWVLFGGFLIVGAAHVAMGSMTHLWQYYAVIIIGRLLLQGDFNLATQVVIAKWFRRQRGRAMAVPNVGRRLGGALVPVFTQAIVSWSGWRMATVALGFYAWALTLIPILLWLRREPRDMGLNPDGDPSPTGQPADGAVSPGARQRSPELSFTLRQALRNRSFYIIIAALSLTTLTNTGITFNMVPLLTDRGLLAAQAIAVVGTWSLVGVPSTLTTGFLSERFTLRYIAALFYLVQCIGVVVLTQAGGLGLGLAFAAVHGWSFASTMFLQNLMLADYFGPASLGAIRGVVTPIVMVANAIGPIAATLVFDTTGSYTAILVGYVVVLAALSASVLLAVPPPQSGPQTAPKAAAPAR